MIFVPRTDRSIVGNWWWTVDRTMLAGVAILALIGTVLIFAASPAVGERVFGAEMHFVYKHLLPAAGQPAAGRRLDAGAAGRPAPGRGHGRLRRPPAAHPLLCARGEGRHRWLPIFGVPLQPSEFVKPGW